MYALSLKRRHDKDNNGMDVIVYLALTAVLLLSAILAARIGHNRRSRDEHIPFEPLGGRNGHHRLA